MVLDAKWTRTIDDALGNKAWDDYDQAIQVEVKNYEKRFGLQVDWLIFKALVWTETGALNVKWKTRPMQIGNKGDKGYAVLKAHRENSGLVMSPELKADLKKGRSVDEPLFNIQLGMAYAYTRLCSYASYTLGSEQFTHKVVAGDLVEKLAKKLGTTKDNIYSFDPSAKVMIRLGQELTFQKAEMRPSGISVTPELLHSRYNVGDPNYPDKLRYCLKVIEKLKR